MRITSEGIAEVRIQCRRKGSHMMCTSIPSEKWNGTVKVQKANRRERGNAVVHSFVGEHTTAETSSGQGIEMSARTPDDG